LAEKAMSAFSEECRRQAARYAEKAAGYRTAGETTLAARCRSIAVDLSDAANNIDLLDQREKAR